MAQFRPQIHSKGGQSSKRYPSSNSTESMSASEDSSEWGLETEDSDEDDWGSEDDSTDSDYNSQDTGSESGESETKMSMGDGSAGEDLNDVDDRDRDTELKEIEEEIRLVSDNMHTGTTNVSIDEEPLFEGNIRPLESYRTAIQTMTDGDFMRREDYSEGTEKLINIAEAQWCRFCTYVMHREDWESCYGEINASIVFNFLDWVMGQRVGKDGRRKRGIKSKASLVTFWCTFRLAFERATNSKINNLVDHKSSSAIIVRLKKRHGLEVQKRSNRPMTIDDLKRQIDTTIRTIDKNFKVGELRILAVLYILFLAPAGSRPASILEMRFGDLEVVLARNPSGGPHRLVIRFTLNYTKRYLGEKAVNTFYIPDMIYDPSLLLNPHIFLLGILCSRRAFHLDKINDNPYDLYKFDIYQGDNEVILHIKESYKHKYIFRSWKRTPMGYEMDDSKRISGTMMSNSFRRVGELAGFGHSTIAYSLRYMAGNKMDQSSSISDALRNTVLGHNAYSSTFQDNYHGRHLDADLWALTREEKPQIDLLHQLTSHGHSVSSRRPIGLSPAQAAEVVRDHPILQRLQAQINKIPLRKRQFRDERQKLVRKLQAEKKRLLRLKKDQVRAEFDRQQATADLNQQYEGIPFEKEARKPTASLSAQHKALVAALTAPPTPWRKDRDARLAVERKRRAAAIQAVISYSEVEEVVKGRAAGKVLNVSRRPAELRQPTQLGKAVKTRGKAVQAVAELDQAEELRRSVFVTKKGERIKRCFVCVAKALTLPPNDPNIPDLCRWFAGERETGRHFRRFHVSRLSDPLPKMDCPMCPGLALDHLMHLQNHAYSVHGVKAQK